MAQFTVYRNKSARSKAAFPLLLDVQSDLLEPLRTRVVVPLTRVAGFVKKPVTHLTPTVEFDGERYVLMTPQLAGISRKDLGPAVGSLAGQRSTILAAIDFLVTGF